MHNGKNIIGFAIVQISRIANRLAARVVEVRRFAIVQISRIANHVADCAVVARSFAIVQISRIANLFFW